MFLVLLCVFVSDGNCTTPLYPNNGFYLTNGVTRPEGTKVPKYALLMYTCNSSYTTGYVQPNSVCVDGEWVPEIKCIREY